MTHLKIDKLIVTQLFKKSLFIESECSSPHSNNQSLLYPFKKYNNIVLSVKPSSFKPTNFFGISDQDLAHVSHLFRASYMTRPPYLPCVGHPNAISCRVQIMKRSIILLCPFSWDFLNIWLNILLDILSSNILSLWPFPNARGKFSYRHKQEAVYLITHTHTHTHTHIYIYIYI